MKNFLVCVLLLAFSIFGLWFAIVGIEFSDRVRKFLESVRYGNKLLHK